MAVVLNAWSWILSSLMRILWYLETSLRWWKLHCCSSRCLFLLLSPDSVRCQLLNDRRTFHCYDYFIIGGIRTCLLGVSCNPMLLWISLPSCSLNFLLVRSHQAETIIVKRLILGRNNATRVRVEPRSCDRRRRKNDAFAISATLPVVFTFLPCILFAKWDTNWHFLTDCLFCYFSCLLEKF